MNRYEDKRDWEYSFEGDQLVVRIPAAGWRRPELVCSILDPAMAFYDLDEELTFWSAPSTFAFDRWWMATTVMQSLVGGNGDFDGDYTAPERRTLEDYRKKVAAWTEQDWGTPEDRQKFEDGATLVWENIGHPQWLEGTLRGARLVLAAISVIPSIEDEVVA